MELEHRAYWVIKFLNFNAKNAAKKRLIQLNKLEEFRLQAYESSHLYKEKDKKWHDQKILPRTFHVGQKVLLFNSRLWLFPGKLKSRWSGLFIIKKVFPHRAVETANLENTRSFKVNGQRLKLYLGGDAEREKTTFTLEQPHN